MPVSGDGFDERLEGGGGSFERGGQACCLEGGGGRGADAGDERGVGAGGRLCDPLMHSGGAGECQPVSAFFGEPSAEAVEIACLG